MELAGLPDQPDSLERAHQLLRQRRTNEALSAYNLAESAGYPPDQCAAGRWICWMLTGDFELAWRESDAIKAIGLPDPNRFWDGQPFDGRRVLLRALHGYGDAVQFIRYAPILRRRAARVTVQAHAELMPLLRTVQGVDEIMTWPDPPAGKRCWDQQIEIMELPRAFRTTLRTIPNRMPYISVARPLIELSRHRLARTSKPKVGLLWAASQYDTSRSVGLRVLLPILRMREFEFYSFQRGAERAQLETISNPVNDTASHSHSIMDTAADLINMDLVITVDTFAAHLAAALNRPLWLLLPYAADWRWMLKRRDSPWYPSMKLFRQPAPGEWQPVISEIREELGARYDALRMTLSSPTTGSAHAGNARLD